MVDLVGGLLGKDYKPRARSALSERFLIPPFSVLNAREGAWQSRKRAWLALGIRSELGRGENLLKFSESVMAAQRGEEWGEDAKQEAPTVGLTYAGRIQTQDGGYATNEDENVLTGTSIFDPVLTEIAYRWFCPAGGHVLDPFAGGSVRGIVAGELGLQYTGIDLSEHQARANDEQADKIGTKPRPCWLVGDSRDICELVTVQGYDFLFSCPPYGHLEVYSDDPRDISALSPEGFAQAYRKIILESCALLKDGSFAAFVVGDYRDEQGFYCSLPAQTIVYFEEAGLRLYNQAILITSIGSLPMRINAQFNGSRKLGNTHQHLLCFAKGQPKDFVKRWAGTLLDKEVK